MNVAYNMDCMKYMKTCPDKYFDLAVVDPPYRDIEENQPFPQMRATGSLRTVFANGKPNDVFFQEIRRVSKNQIIFGANNFSYPFKGFIAWDKCVRGSENYSQIEIASLSDGLSTVSTVVEITTYSKENKVHPTQKPVDLYRWIYRRFAKPGDKIFDSHLGSGSSRIAAYDAGLDFVGCEIDPVYFKAEEERYEKFISQRSIFDADYGATEQTSFFEGSTQ